jgi:hypothetical protein
MKHENDFNTANELPLGCPADKNTFHTHTHTHTHTHFSILPTA